MTVSRNARFELLTVAVLLLSATLSASVGGSISGTVTDPTGAVISGSLVTALNINTGVKQKVKADTRGAYAFPILAIGSYDVEITHAGFKPYVRHGVIVDANSALLIDASLDLGGRNETVTVDDTEVHVETISTQMGDLITGAQMTAVPLDGRSYTNLLTLQPGVAPATSINSNTVQDVGASALFPSGDLNPGTISINGQREFANAFIVNGSDAEEDVNMGTAIIPNLDSIAEFRILTNNFDAEYGEFSGGQVNVITKSGTNSFHGDLFEFLRNTDLDARNYFSPERGTFIQNQFGGTFGGPVKRNKIFLFADYQGTRQRQGVDTGEIPVPSLQDRSGDLSDIASSLTTVDALGNTVPTIVNGAGWANTLSRQLGYPVSAGEPYYFARCGSNTQCVLPNAILPAAGFSRPAQNLLQYIPSPNVSGNEFATSAFNQALRDDKGAVRLDANTAWGLVSAYYFLDDYSLDNPYPVAQGGASVPGFNALYTGRAQLMSLGSTRPLGSSAVNEFRVTFMRSANRLGKPVGGLGVTLTSQGFVDASGNPTIVPLAPQNEGVQNIVFNNFSIGTNTNEMTQENNTYQWLDNFSKVMGGHTLKMGGEFHFDQVNVNPIAQFNGNFLFSGSETGSDFADFLLGIPSQYNQSQLNPFYGRNKYTGIYGQDSWHLKSNLTLNYGLRFDRIEPWYEKYNQISVTEPGSQSLIFPTAPPGILYPGDPGVRRTLAPPGDEFSPRVGIAYSPETSEGIFGKMLGGPGKTSIRAGFGLYYTSIEALTIGVLAANAPYGTTYSSPAPPLFNNPFVTASNGQNLGQPFPIALAPLDVSRSHSDPEVDWSRYEPITGIPNYPVSNRIPYTEEYMLSLERELGNRTLLSASYVGTEAHRLLVLEESNPGNPALCLATPGCGPFNEGDTRGPLGSNFGSDTNQSTIGNSNYNALELSLRHTAGPLQIFASYTFSRAMDQSSNVAEEVNPIDPALSYALSAFDVKHNLVVSYSYQLPLARVFRVANGWTKGWAISGITHFSSGFPVTLLNYGDNSLLGSQPNGINNYGVDEPQYTPGSLQLNPDPRNSGNLYFNTALFSLQPLGTPGNSKRRFFHGPGSDNYDMALSKNFRLTEAKSIDFRAEAFNIFNHAQFFGPTAVDGNISSSTFGDVVNAAPPRLMQVALKFNF